MDFKPTIKVNKTEQTPDASLLIVDDEAGVVSALQRLFRDANYNVYTASSGTEGLAILDQETMIDLVISDMRMPKMDGAEFFEHVSHQWPATLRILLTGDTERTATIAAVNKGHIYYYINKPWDNNALLLTVKHALAHKRLVEKNLLLKHENIKQQKEFISIVSHELRTPLTAIYGSLKLLTSGALGRLPKEIQKTIEIAERNSERLTRLTNDILDIERLESGHAVIEHESLSLLPCIEQAVEAIRPYSAQYNVNLTVRSSYDDAVTYGDSFRLKQVLTNLISNAVKFSPPYGEVTISLKKSDGQIYISVSDHGRGIPEEFRDRIFGKFSQVESDDAHKKGGCGLGLAIAKEIVELHGGSIGLDSELGHGTRFFFTLSEFTPSRASC